MQLRAPSPEAVTSLPESQYDPLTQSMHTRIVVLHPGEDDTDISCHLEHVDLNKRPSYEALSYAWGDELQRKLIRCGAGRLSITASLHGALKYLRLAGNFRAIWADAICIDQQNIPERNMQVRGMAQIYASAACTVVWLGEETDNTMGAIDAFLEASRMLPHQHIAAMSPSLEERTAFCVKALESNIDWNSMSYLLLRSWFRRKWIIQEVIKSRRILVMHGARHINWGIIYQVVSGLMTLGATIHIPSFSLNTGVPFALTNIVSLGTFRDTAEDDYAYAVISSRSFQCKDPRDHLFALYGLASDAESLGPELQPDYATDFMQLMVNYVRWSLRDRNDLRFLGSTEYRGGGISARRLMGSRFWPYSCYKLDTLCRHNAARNTAPSARVHDNGRELYVRGYALAEVQVLAAQLVNTLEFAKQSSSDVLADTSPTAENGAAQIHQLLREWKSIASCGSGIMSPVSLASLARTAVWDMAFEGGKSHPNFPERFAQYMEVVELIMEEHDAEWWGNAMSIIADVEQLLIARSSFRKLCRTTNGILGMVPGGSEAGDRICMFYGGRVLYVLRPCGDGKHKFVGECYLDGFMDGEAMDLHVANEEFILI